MTPFVLHCGDCGKPLRDGDHTDCARQPVYVYDHFPHRTDDPSGRLNADEERAALIADITAVLSMANVPPPVTPPGVGGALVPAGPTPFAPIGSAPVLPTANRFVLRYGVYVCSVCNLVKDYCNCAKRAVAIPAQDGAESSLEARIRDAKGRP